MGHKTKSEKFVSDKKDIWEQLRRILVKIPKGGFSYLSETETSEFPRLYRLVCADLAEAKMLKLSPDVIDYLNNIVGQAHKRLYSFPPLRKSALNLFFRETLPQVILKNWRFVVISAVFFLLPYLVSYIVVVQEPKLAGLIVPESVLDMMEESYSKGFTKERAVSVNTLMVSYYIYNNVSISFFCFAGGVVLGIGTLYYLVYNGLVLGAVTGYIVGIGYGDNFFNFVTAHSVFELTGLVFAGASGLALGYTIINVKKYTRKDWFNLQKDNLFTLVSAAALLIFCAAFIEGLISPTTIPYAIKASIAITCGILILFYFFILPGLQLKNKKS